MSEVPLYRLRSRGAPVPKRRSRRRRGVGGVLFFRSEETLYRFLMIEVTLYRMFLMSEVPLYRLCTGCFL
jgi:hypothetical protein